MSEILSRVETLLHNVERSLDNFKKLGKNNYTPAKIRSRMESLKDTWNQCVQTHAALTQAIPETKRDAIEYLQVNQSDDAFDTYQDTLDYTAECLEELEPRASSFLDAGKLDSRAQAALSISHLPAIKLPPFSGKFEEWESFRDRFTSLIIENPDLSSFARMHFLTSSLTGRALDAVRGLPVTADNFEIAWKTLTSRIENKRRLVELHVASLFNLPILTCESASELTALRDQANRAIASLRSLGRKPEEMLSDILVYGVSQKLNPVTRKAWKLRGSDDSSIPSMDELDKFLGARARALEESTPARGHGSSRASKQIHANAATASGKSCPLCQDQYFVNRCSQFRKKTPQQRCDTIKRLKLCTNCLSSKHKVQECTSTYTCRTCQQRHHSMLHVDHASANATATEQKDGDRTESPKTPVATAMSARQLASRTLRCCSPPLESRSARSQTRSRTRVVRALLDQGPELTFITEALRKRLNLRRSLMPLAIAGIGGVRVGECQYAARVHLSPPGRSHPVVTAAVSVLPSLTEYIPSCSAPIDSWGHSKGLKLADPDPTSSDPIDILIGADTFSELIVSGVRKGKSGEPVARTRRSTERFTGILHKPLSCV